MELGCTLKVYTYDKTGVVGVWHYGIVSAYEENTETLIIHFCSNVGDSTGEKRIRETSISWFLENGKQAQVVHEEPAYDYKTIVQRARSQIGKGKYDLTVKNCEHFSSWCSQGYSYSSQVAVNGIIAIAAIALGAIFGVLRMSRTQWK
jgi:hypothetical protein